MVAGGESRRQACCTLVPEEVGVKEKTGTWGSATFHIVTAMVGAGVLAMPQALGALGWIAGPLCVFAFYAVSLLASWLLAALFEVDGVQYPRYFEAVAGILGGRAEILAATFQLTNIFLVCIAFSITSAMSMTEVADLLCDLPAPETERSGEEGCFNQQWKFTLMFGAAEILLVQLPNMDSSWLVSAVGAVVAILYMGIALGLGIGKVVDGAHHGSLGGISYETGQDKAFAVLNALGTIGFAYGFSQVFLEVQDTLREPPKAKVSMRKAAGFALTLGFAGYLAVSVVGYLAFGNEVPDNILTAFENPKWSTSWVRQRRLQGVALLALYGHVKNTHHLAAVVDLWLVITAQFFVLINMLASYSLFAQTIFLTLEGWVCHKLGLLHPAEEAALELVAVAVAASSTASKEIDVRSHSVGDQPGSLIHARAALCTGSNDRPTGAFYASRMCAWFRAKDATHRGCGTSKGQGRHRLVWSFVIRSVYVLLTTAVAVLIPFFGAIVGLIGALVFWPLAVYFPFQMYKKAYEPKRRTVLLLNVILIVMLAVSLGAIVGSVRNIIVSWEDFELFG